MKLKGILALIMIIVIAIRGKPDMVNGQATQTLVCYSVKPVQKERTAATKPLNTETKIKPVIKLKTQRDKRAVKFMKSRLGEWITDYSYSEGIDPFLIFAIAERESGFNAGAVGDRGASIGLMQIQPRWSRERMKRLKVKDLKNPRDSVKVAVDILQDYKEKNNDLYFVLMAYNGGENYAKKHNDTPNDYAVKVSERAFVLCRLYEEAVE